MNKKAKFLFFCMIFVGPFTYGQDYTMQSLAKLNHKPLVSKYLLHSSLPVVLSNKPLFSVGPTAYPAIDPAFYTQNFGFFCKKELQLEKVTKLPLRFRLGSMQQCDWLEGKPNSGIR
jgi:hypothetical protein